MAGCSLPGSDLAGLTGQGITSLLDDDTQVDKSDNVKLIAHLPLTGVFATRSPDRPNPLGLHRVKVLARSGNTLEVAPLEAIDGTPIVDIKPVLNDSADS